MHTRRMATIVSVVVTLSLLLAARYTLAGSPAQQGAAETQAAAAAPLGTSFTYQGRLLDAGQPASGSYDLQFKLYNAASAGTQLGSTVQKDDMAVTTGLFTVELDFGSGVFTGDARWLEIAVRPGSSTGAFTTVTPRLPLTAVPYAHSLRPGASVETGAGNALNLSTSGTSGTALNALASATSGNTAAVYGSSSSPGGAGLSGYNSSSGYGVYGSAGGSTGIPYGVYGLASHAGSATSYGVYGKSNSSLGTGVGGEAPWNGIFGKATASGGYGVYGEASAASGTNYGVYGKAISVSGYGVYGQGGYYGVYGSGTDPVGVTYGVYGISTGPAGYGVKGQSTYRQGVRGESTYGAGVYGTASTTGTVGIATASGGPTWGVYGQSNAPSGYGVYGENTSSGATYGVYGVNASSSGAGVMGTSKNAAGSGVRGETVNGHALEGVVDWTKQGRGAAVYGSGGFYGYGASFENATALTPTVLIQNYAADGLALDVRGATTIAGETYIEGNTHISGTLTLPAKKGYVSISAAAFHPRESEALYLRSGYYFSHSEPLQDDLRYFFADVQLPHGAVVTQFTFCWSLEVDYPSVTGIIYLHRLNLPDRIDTAGGTWEEDMAGGTTTSTQAFRMRCTSDTTISAPLIQNNAYTYFVKAIIPGYVIIHGVVIEYEFGGPY
ncbi:MAG: hypothetical protein FJ026_06375 [Chloroflexi bacterium]|nr:hypothetical protein [Chloroflexota bacterium]